MGKARPGQICRNIQDGEGPPGSDLPEYTVECRRKKKRKKQWSNCMTAVMRSQNSDNDKDNIVIVLSSDLS